MVIVISTTLTVTSFLSHTAEVKYRCIDVNGIRTSPFMWVDWLFTVPSIFFLVSAMKPENNLNLDSRVQQYSALAIICLYLSNFEVFPTPCLYLSMLAAIGFMSVALVWNHLEISREFNDSFERYQRSALEHVFKVEGKLSYKLNNYRMNCTLFITIAFPIYFLLYCTRFFGYILDEEYIMLVSFANFIVKALFAQIIFDVHAEILQPTHYELGEKIRKSEIARWKSLRYIFHEVRVPLNTIGIGATLLQETNSLKGLDEDDTLNMISESAESLNCTLNEFLSMQRLEQQSMKIANHLFDIREIINTLYVNLKNFGKRRKVDVHTRISADVPTKFMGDAIQLKLAIGATIRNAILRASENTAVEVEVTLDISKKYVTISVSSKGSPLETELKEAILHSVDVTYFVNRSVGFGLAIAKRVVELHEGLFSIHTTSDGNCFEINLKI